MGVKWLRPQTGTNCFVPLFVVRADYSQGRPASEHTDVFFCDTAAFFLGRFSFPAQDLGLGSTERAHKLKSHEISETPWKASRRPVHKKTIFSRIESKQQEIPGASPGRPLFVSPVSQGVSRVYVPFSFLKDLPRPPPKPPCFAPCLWGIYLSSPLQQQNINICDWFLL